MRVDHPHNRPLYLTAEINGVLFKRALIDNGFTVNIMSYATFKTSGLKDFTIQRHIISITGFGSNVVPTIGSVFLHLHIGELKTTAKVHIIDAETTYHVLLGRAWLHQHKVVPSILHQCTKAIHARKMVILEPSVSPFPRAESHFAVAMFFLRSFMILTCPRDSSQSTQAVYCSGCRT